MTDSYINNQMIRYAQLHQAEHYARHFYFDRVRQSVAAEMAEILNDLKIHCENLDDLEAKETLNKSDD